MKILKNIGLVAGVALILCSLFFYNAWQNCKIDLKASEDAKQELIDKCDSILALPPDTFYTDPEIILKDTVIYSTKWKEKPNDPAILPQIYNDSIINDSINLRVKITADELYSIDYAYRPIYKYQEKIIEKKIPHPVEVIKQIEVQKRALYFSAGLGYSEDFAGKLGVLYLTRKNNFYAYDFVRYGTSNIHFISYGVKF